MCVTYFIRHFGVKYGTGWSGTKGCEDFVIAVGFSQPTTALVLSDKESETEQFSWNTNDIYEPELFC